MSDPISLVSNESGGAGSKRTSWDEYKRRLFLAVGLVAFLLVFASFVSVTLDVLLLLFLCTLIAVGLRGTADWLAERTPLSSRVALAVVLLILIGLIIGVGLVVGPRVAEQFSSLNTTLSTSLQQIEEQWQAQPWGEELLNRLPTTSELINQVLGQTSTLFGRITGIFSTILSVLSSFVIVIFLSLFLAYEPETYVNGFLHLIPQTKRDRVYQTLAQVSQTLRKWLLTRAASMVVIGVLSALGLQLIGMPLVLSLSLIAAIGALIPTFGPILALIPAVLVALLSSPQQAVYVVILYTGAQMVDNYITTPVLQKTMLYLPPAYIIAAQLLFGVVAGAFGLVLAAPIAAALVVVVRNLYVQDVLRDDVKSEQG